MAWTSPRTWIAGETVTAALMNTHIRDNETELRAGGIALASQAANDFGYPSSATQWARVAGGANAPSVWGSWTPTYYKNDNATELATSVNSAVYAQIGRCVFYLLTATFSGTPDTNSFFTTPVAGNWTSGAAPEGRGRGFGNSVTAGAHYITGTGNSGTRLKIHGTINGVFTAFGFYELA